MSMLLRSQNKFRGKFPIKNPQVLNANMCFSKRFPKTKCNNKDFDIRYYKFIVKLHNIGAKQTFCIATVN